MMGQSLMDGPVKQKAIFDLMNLLLSLDKVDLVLQAIVEKAPALVDSSACSIFLIPGFVTGYNGTLIDDDGRSIDSSQIQDQFVVLTASTQFGKCSDSIAKHFYRSGEGLTGWVFKNRQALLLNDMRDESEIRQYPSLQWKNKYRGAQHYYDFSDNLPKPFLAVPLIFGNNCFGVIRVAATSDRSRFPNWAKEMFISFGGVISHRIEIEHTLREQKKSIEKLIKTGGISLDNQQSAFNVIVEEAQKLTRSSVCSLYLPDRAADTVELRASSDKSIAPDIYKRNEGFIGWIFKTGKPLLINDTAVFRNKTSLTDEELSTYSDAHLKNSDDEKRQKIGRDVLQRRNQFSKFLGVPILTSGGKSQGVVIIRSGQTEEAFTSDDLVQLEEIAANISMLITNLERQKLNRMLIRIGQEHGHKLFQYVVEQLPELVFARGCSIFLKAKESDRFMLSYTNSPGLMEDPVTKKPKAIAYAIGSGKTGLIGQLGRALVINHYGTGSLDQQRLQADYTRYTNNPIYKDDNLVGLLKNQKGKNVGLTRLIKNRDNEHSFSTEEKRVFKQFVKSTFFTEKGLPPSDRNYCEEGPDGYTMSFLGCPLKDMQGDVFGVLRIPRSFPGGTFTTQAIEVVTSVSNRLSSIIERDSAIIENERILEQNLRNNLMTLSDIMTQINSSFGSKDLNNILQSILDAVTHTLGFEFAAIQLVDWTDNTIYTAIGMKNNAVSDAPDPNRWKDKARHPLDPPKGRKRDIHALILRKHKKEKIIKGFNTLLY
jgi:transcriptional regulator with GAF, ATPase, and Fis domain